MELMPREKALIEAAAALARSNPFSLAHRDAAAALDCAVQQEPVWIARTARRALVDTLRPHVQRLRARALRQAPVGEALQPLIEGLAAAWVAAAAPEEPDAYDLQWLGSDSAMAPDALATVRAARLGLLESIVREWPGPGARAFREAVWRAAWLGDPFLDVRGTGWALPLPVLIRGAAGAPRVRVAALIACADPWGTADEPPPMWRCHLPATDAADRVRAPGVGLRFIDRLELASQDVQSALVEQIDESAEGPRWTFGMTSGADLGALDVELYHRICGVELDIPPLPELLTDGGLPLYADRALALAGVPDRGAQVDGFVRWIEEHRGRAYDWPGHLSELNRYVRAHLAGQPIETPRTPPGAPSTFWAGVDDGTLDADTLLSRYCTWVYAITGSYVATAARLGIDRRTVRKRVDTKLLPTFRPR